MVLRIRRATLKAIVLNLLLIGLLLTLGFLGIQLPYESELPDEALPDAPQAVLKAATPLTPPAAPAAHIDSVGVTEPEP